jgi:hypothetical protein
MQAREIVFELGQKLLNMILLPLLMNRHLEPEKFQQAYSSSHTDNAYHEEK